MYQLIANIIFTASTVMIVAVGFAIIYNTTHFFHFAHGVVFTVGAYLAYSFYILAEIPLGFACLLAWIGTAFLGLGLELCIYRPLRRRNGSPLVLLIASLGLYVLIQNLISLIFGDDTKTIRSISTQEGLKVLGAQVTPIQIIIIVLSVVLVTLTYLLMRMTKLGRAIRATANDVELAKIAGIETDVVMLSVFTIGSALAGLGGILVALDVDMTPTMGMNALMMGIVAVIIGGIGSIPGIALGAILLSAAQHLGVWTMGSQWQDAIAFVILLTFLLLKPEGFMGKKVKKVTL